MTTLSGCFGSSSNNRSDPAVEAVEVTPVEGISVASGTPLEQVIQGLPASTTLQLANGEERSVTLSWQLSEQVKGSRGDFLMDQVYYPTARGDYEFTGKFELPGGVSGGDLATEVKALVAVQSGPLISVTDTTLFTQPGTYQRATLTFSPPEGDDVERSFVYYVPSGYDGSTPLPMMFNFHGAGSYGAGQMFYSGFDKVAEEHDFIVVAPDHGFSALGVFQFPSTDVFADAIIDYMIDEYEIDEQRVYASGISMGGLASQTLALKLGHRIAAIAPVAMPLDSLLNEDMPRPMTVVAFYGTEDSGYPGSFDEALLHVAAQNNTDLNPIIEENWAATEDDVTSITRYTYAGGTHGNEVVFYEIHNGGHTWPGKYQYASLITVGLTTQHIDATEVIWEHLSQHSLP